MRKFPFTADTSLMVVTDASGIRLDPDSMVLVFGDEVLFAGHFVETLGGAVSDLDLSSATALRCTVRAERNDDDTENPALTWQYVYNDGHYTAGEDLEEGLVTWLVPFAGTDLETAIDAADEDGLTLWVEISATLGAGAENQTLAQFQIRLYDQLDSGAVGTPAPTSPTYLTAAEVAIIAATKAPNEANRSDIGRDLVDGDNLFVGTGLLAACSRMYTYIAAKLAAAYGLLSTAHAATLTGGAASDADALHTHATLAAVSSTAKTTLADADRLTLWDSAASLARKYITWANVRSALEAAYGLLTGAQKSTLTGGGDADTLHTHALLALASHNHDTAYEPLIDRVATPTGATALGTVYHLSGGAWVAADPDTAACETAELWMALGATGASGMVAQGVVTNPAWSWSAVGLLLWLDDSGALTETVPNETSHAGRVARPVGWVRSATSIRFNGHLLGSSYAEIGS